MSLSIYQQHVAEESMAFHIATVNHFAPSPYVGFSKIAPTFTLPLPKCAPVPPTRGASSPLFIMPSRTLVTPQKLLMELYSPKTCDCDRGRKCMSRGSRRERGRRTCGHIHKEDRVEKGRIFIISS